MGKAKAFSEAARMLGAAGGHARARALTATQRRRIARRAALIRWHERDGK